MSLKCIITISQSASYFSHFWTQQREAGLKLGKTFTDSLHNNHTLSDLIDRSIQDVLQKDQCPLRQLWWWKRQAGAMDLDEITPALIIEYRDKLA
jgi:hypothetical protein